MPVPVARHHSTSAGGTSSTEKKPLARGEQPERVARARSAASRGDSGPSGTMMK